MLCVKYILLYKMSFLFLFSRERLLFSRTIFSVYYKYGTEDITYWFGNPHVHKYHINVASFTVEGKEWNNLGKFSINLIFCNGYNILHVFLILRLICMNLNPDLSSKERIYYWYLRCHCFSPRHGIIFLIFYHVRVLLTYHLDVSIVTYFNLR